MFLHQLPDYLGNWLLQIIGILFPMLLFQSYFFKKYGRSESQKYIISILCGASILICMTFPVSINDEYLLDFRFIPLLMGYVYGGLATGAILSFVLLLYRWVLGGVGFYFGGLLMVVLFFLIFLWALRKMANWAYQTQTYFLYGMLTLSLVIFALGTQVLDDYQFNADEVVLWIWFSILNYFTFWMLRHLQDSLAERDILINRAIQFEKKHALNQLFIYLLQQNNTPIQFIKDYVHLLEKEAITYVQIHYCNRLNEEIKKLEQNQDYYWNFFEEHHDQKQSVDLHHELLEVLNIIKPFSQHYKVDMDFISTMENETTIQGVPSLVRVMFLNIIKNAIEASPTHGRISIALHDLIEQVYIVVEDNGSGIPSHILPKIGEPLKSNKTNGSGFGLATAFKIIESIGGRIEIDSNSERGTTFSLYFQKADYI